VRKPPSSLLIILSLCPATYTPGPELGRHILGFFVRAPPPRAATMSGVEVAAAVMRITGFTAPTDVFSKWSERRRADRSKVKQDQEGPRGEVYGPVQCLPKSARG
jgi:hypothetical protein